ncbi:MAG: preprotein translocase subunit SecG [Bacteroidales bacterium]|jgi:preprotein translocase subunit SecG|nr:preprotein translocase subunit SecG [Bacteroidales bacterium]
MGVYILIAVIILIFCLLLALVVLIQNPKGGGLSSTFGGQGNQFLGVRKTTDFLEKSTWAFAGVILLLSLFSAYSIPRDSGGTPDEISTQLSVDENALRLPTLPTQQPQQTPTE